jgi:acetate kinase
VYSQKREFPCFFPAKGKEVAPAQPYNILAINSGSSSLKFSVYQIGEGETLFLTGKAERIGLPHGLCRMKDATGRTLVETEGDLPNHAAALREVLDRLKNFVPGRKLAAAGHRVVHGGSKYIQPQKITPELMAALREMIPLAPDHLPQEIEAIQAIQEGFPGLPQVACFDTAFHRQMPEMAQMYGLPRALWREGLIRYGFHGLSYEYILKELEKEAGEEAAGGRVIIAHLGNGASMVAVRRGKSLDTTMGFTPGGGLMMSTRSGDLGPGVILYLLREKGMDATDVNMLVNQKAGLLGVSGISSDMEDLLLKEKEYPHAAEAVSLFCYQAKKFLGAYVAVLGGLDTLIFTGGIGEKAAPVRRRICAGCEFMGIHLDPGRNEAHAPLISRDGSPAAVRVMRTNEELMIVRHTHQVLDNGSGKMRAER